MALFPRILASLMAALLATLPLALPAGAEELHLANGDRLTGRVVRLGDTTVEIDLGYAVVPVPRARVLRIVLGRAGETLRDGSAIDELLALVESSGIRFLLDGRRVEGRELAESARLRAHLLGSPNDARIFVDRCLSRSERGKRVYALLPDGRRVPVSDWLDAARAGTPPPANPPKVARKARHVRGGATLE